MGAKVWTGKGGASVADPDNWEHLTTAQFNFVENGGEMSKALNCPRCTRRWPLRSDQAVAVCKYGKCLCCMAEIKQPFSGEAVSVESLLNTDAEWTNLQVDQNERERARKDSERRFEAVNAIKRGITTRAAAEKAHSDTVKDLAGAGCLDRSAKIQHAERMSEQAAAMIGMAPEDLYACGGEAETVPVRTIGGKLFNVPEEGATPPGDIIDSPTDAHEAVPLDDSDEYQVLYVTPWGDELEAVIVDKVRMHPGYYELLCAAVSEKPFICCKSDIKSARKVTLEPGDRVDIPGDSLSWFERSLPFWMFVLMVSLCSFAAGAAWYRFLPLARG